MSVLLLALILAIAIQIILFIPAFIFKTDKLTDLSYAITFILLAGLMLTVNNLTIGKIILFLMILVWALRLGIYLFVRIKKIKRDQRFDGIRENFIKFGGFWLMQGISVWIIMLACFLYFGSNSAKLNIFILVGFMVWLVGFLIESTADYQKFKFNNNIGNKGKWIDKGLWKYSRHPNYFGEILIWVGIYLFTFSSLSGINIFIGLISPLFVAFLLIFITGIPKLEKAADVKWGENSDYMNYKKRTSILILLPNKKNNSF
jgi:steroid 5-alpha reductase family enzyme